MRPHVLHSHPAASFFHYRDHPRHGKEAPGRGAPSLPFSVVGCVLPYAHHLLDLLGQGLLLLLSPTLMALMPSASFLLHQPALGDPARLFPEVVAVLARVAHRQSP